GGGIVELMSWRRVVWAGLLFSGCGSGAESNAGQCASLDRAACEASDGCMPLMAWDVTRTGAGGSCWEGPAGDWGDPVFLRCMIEARGGGTIAFRYDPSAERCYAFESNNLVPSGWRECEDVLPQCICRSDGDCSDGEGCIYY